MRLSAAGGAYIAPQMPLAGLGEGRKREWDKEGVEGREEREGMEGNISHLFLYRHIQNPG